MSYVDVELVRFTDNKLGINGDPDIVTLANQQVTIAGKLFVDADFKVATSKFTVDASSGDTLVGGELAVTSMVTLSDNLVFDKDDADISHTGSGKLVISSTNSYVDVESVRFTLNKIGINGDPDLVELGSNNVKIGAILEVSDDVLLTETNAFLTHSAASGSLKIASTNGFVDVESVRFTDNSIGIAAQDDIMTLTTNKLGIHANVDVGSSVFTVAVTTGDTAVTGNFDVGPTTGRTFEVTASDGSLAIATDKFKVDGSNGDTLIAGTLGVTAATALSNTLAVTGDVTVNTNKFKVTAVDGSLAIATNKFKVAGASGDTLIAGTLGVAGATTLSSTLAVSSDMTVNTDKFKVTASDGSLAITTDKFTVAAGAATPFPRVRLVSREM